MESMTVTSADGNGTLAVQSAVPAHFYVHSATAAKRSAGLRRLLATADLVAGALSGLVAGLIANVSLPQVALLGLTLAIAWPLAAFACGLYAADDLRSWASGVSEAPKLVLSSLLLSWPLFGMLGILDAQQAVRAALAASVLVAATAGLARAGARSYAHHAKDLRQRTLVIGSGLVADQLVARLLRHEELALDPIGFLDADGDGHGQMGVPALGGLEALPELLRSERVDRVMIAFSRAGHEELLHCIRLCRDAGVAVDVIPRLFEFLDGARVLDQIGGMPLMSIGASQFSRASQVAKRGLDIVGSSLTLLVMSPLLIAIAIAIKVDSRGPALFVQHRPGRRGVLFPVLKFRSMHEDADVLFAESGHLVKLVNDRRITRVGRFLRRFSLDEAPQLINVLRGDMSLVGPRPLVAAEADALTEDWQARRSDLRPGLTGPWQISGRSHIPFEERLALDYQYVAGWSLARDLEILLATVPAVLSGRGAY